jgi:hypothetical protein
VFLKLPCPSNLSNSELLQVINPVPIPTGIDLIPSRSRQKSDPARTVIETLSIVVNTANDPNNLLQFQKNVFSALEGINNYIVTGPSTMTFKESQQVYAEILFISQYLGIRRVLENNIIGFTDRCKNLHLEFMLNDFIDEGLLEFFYAQIFHRINLLIKHLDVEEI